MTSLVLIYTKIMYVGNCYLAKMWSKTRIISYICKFAKENFLAAPLSSIVSKNHIIYTLMSHSTPDTLWRNFGHSQKKKLWLIARMCRSTVLSYLWSSVCYDIKGY